MIYPEAVTGFSVSVPVTEEGNRVRVHLKITVFAIFLFKSRPVLNRLKNEPVLINHFERRRKKDVEKML